MPLRGVIKCLPTLEKIAKSRSLEKRLELLKHAEDCIFYAIGEIFLNILNGNIRVSNKRREKLKPYRLKIRRIASKNLPKQVRKQLIIQSGGFLPSLIIPAVSFLAEIAAKKFLK